MAEIRQPPEIPKEYAVSIYSPDFNYPVPLNELCPDIDQVLALLRSGIAEGADNMGSNRTDELMAGRQPDKFVEGWYASINKTDQRIVNALLVVRDQRGNPVGVLESNLYNFRGNMAGFIAWVVTDPNSRKKGIAQTMYAEFEKFARESGAELLVAAINQKNKISKKFHKKNGFVDEQNEMRRSTPLDRSKIIKPKRYKDVNREGKPIKVEIRYWKKQLGPSQISSRYRDHVMAPVES